MKEKLLLRIAAGCLLFFALGHSIGHFTRHNVTNPKAREVLQSMSENKFDMFGQMRSFDENYTGMSFNLIFTLISFVVLIWILSCNVGKEPRLIRNLIIPITACVLGFCITSFLYFFMMPAITCLLATILLVTVIFKLQNRIV